MANNRIFYACQAVGLKPMGNPTGDYKVAHGVQSVGITTNFNLEQAFELGQIQIYENIEGLPDVEVTQTFSEIERDDYSIFIIILIAIIVTAGIIISRLKSKKG